MIPHHTVGPTFTADGITMQVTGRGGADLEAEAERQEADLVLNLESGLRVGYSGYYGCGS